MFVILTYDVAAKRARHILKTCKRYLSHEQRSVFEGTITRAKLEALKKELQRYIVAEEDSVQIYEFESLRYSAKEKIGRKEQHDNIF